MAYLVFWPLNFHLKFQMLLLCLGSLNCANTLLPDEYYLQSYLMSIDRNPVQGAVRPCGQCSGLQIKQSRWKHWLGILYSNGQDTLCTYQRPFRGIDPREPLGICTKTFTNSTYQGPIFFHKKLPLSLPRERNLKRLPNCNIISGIIFHKSLAIIYTVSKNS